MKSIQNSDIYRSLCKGRTDVEIWDDNYEEAGWAYYSIVAHSQGTARKLAYVRLNGERIQKRTYDNNGDDLWVDTA
jgi:hypothetical protein